MLLCSALFNAVLKSNRLKNCKIIHVDTPEFLVFLWVVVVCGWCAIVIVSRKCNIVCDCL